MTFSNHDDINYKNNPLHSVGLKKMLVQLSDHYGFEILFAYLNINCFRNNPSVASSAKFLKKTPWAREKVEAFYLYQFKNLPKVAHDQYPLSPRDRIIPEDQSPKEPAVLSLEEAAELKAQREMRAANFDAKKGSGGEKAQGASKPSRRSNGRENKSRHSDRRTNTAASKRTASTPENPWGLPRE